MNCRTFIFAAMLGTLSMASAATAKDARCFTSDDGEYACEFHRLDDAGSFRISAHGKPTFELWIEGQGTAYGYGVYTPGGRSVSLPGMFIRSKKDRACWTNDTTEAEICAW